MSPPASTLARAFRAENRVPLLLALALALLGMLAAVYLPAFEPASALHAEGLDDAYISYRYAANLAAGEGLVFNSGERLEGFSNLLWVLLAALLLQLGSPAGLHAAMVGLTALLAAAALLVFHGEMRRRAGGFAAAAAAACWVFYPFLWPWIGSGLETIAMVLLQLLIWRSLSRGEEPAWTGLGVWLSLAVLLRADGFVLAAIAAGHFLLAGEPRRALRTLLLAAPATLALFAFRLLYYRDLWPSTYYVKVTRGLFDRLYSAFGQLGELLTHFLLAPFLAALVWELWRRRAEQRAEQGPLRLPPELTLGAGLLAYWLYIGGDVFRIRFLLVLVPFGLAVIFGSFAQGLARRHLGGLAALLLAAYASLVFSLPDFRWQAQRYDAWIELGEFLGKRHPGAVLAADGVGKVPYFSGLATIDMLGLTDAHISKLPPSRRERPGHEKSDPAYVLGRRPDLIAGHLWPSFEISPDLEPALYRAAGYRLLYLVNIAPDGAANSILPAPAEEADYPLLAAQGYRYAVLARAAPPAAP